MKKVFAITFLLVHVFNWVGYKVFFYYSGLRTSAISSLQIERNQYSDDDLILVKVPVTLPYAQQTTDYERYDGEIEWGGEHYNYVKRMISKDTLFLLCLPDQNKTALAQAKNNYASHANDLHATQKATDSSVKKANFSADFECWPEALPGKPFIIASDLPYGFYLNLLLHTYLSPNIQPPDVFNT